LPFLPSSLALSTVPTNSEILSASHRNNYSDIQTAVNALITGLGGGTEGQFLKYSGGTPVWAAGSGGATMYRKSSTKDVVNTTTETDILNGEITLAALTSTNIVRVVVNGDYLNNSGGTSALTLGLKLGATTIWKETIVSAANSFASANRRPFLMRFVIANLGVTNSQQCTGLAQVGGEGAPTNGIGGAANGGLSPGMAGTANHGIWVAVRRHGPRRTRPALRLSSST